MSKIKMGVIGVGNISGVHINGINRSPDAELVAICDIDEGTLKIKGDKFKVPEDHRFKNHIDLLNCSDVDAVSICTPNNCHYPIAADAIRYNKPFALEKPVTMVYEEARRLRDMAAEKGLPHMVCFSYRFKAAARFARALVQQGFLGDIHHVYGRYLYGSAVTDDKPLVWRFRKETSGYGSLGDLGSHLVDLTRFIAGDFTKLTAGAGIFIGKRKLPGSDEIGAVDVDDYCDMIGTLDRGAAASLSVSRFAYARNNFQCIEVYGNKGGLIYTLKKGVDSLKICAGEAYSCSEDYHEIAIPKQYQTDQMQSFFDVINGKGDGLAANMNDGAVNQLVLDSIADAFENEKWVHLK